MALPSDDGVMSAPGSVDQPPTATHRPRSRDTAAGRGRMTLPAAASFWVLAVVFAAAMAFSTVPTPLYAFYRQRDGFSTFMITVIFAAYAVGVIGSLFLAGHISDWFGRRRLAL